MFRERSLRFNRITLSFSFFPRLNYKILSIKAVKTPRSMIWWRSLFQWKSRILTLPDFQVLNMYDHQRSKSNHYRGLLTLCSSTLNSWIARSFRRRVVNILFTFSWTFGINEIFSYFYITSRAKSDIKYYLTVLIYI